MGGIGVEIPGLDAVIGAYQQESKRIAREQKRALLAAARPVKMEAKRQAPYQRGGWKAWKAGQRSKPLHTTITSKVYADPFTGTKVVIRSSSRIARLVILGTADHMEPKSGTSKKPMPLGNGRFAMRVHHPATRPNDFLTRALEMTRTAAVEAYRSTLFPPGGMTK